MFNPKSYTLKNEDYSFAPRNNDFHDKLVFKTTQNTLNWKHDEFFFIILQKADIKLTTEFSFYSNKMYSMLPDSSFASRTKEQLFPWMVIIN